MINKNRKEAIREYFSIEVKKWDYVYKENDSIFNYEMQKRKEIVFDFINKTLNRKKQYSLDIGCGAGHYVKGMIELGLETYGADLSEKMIRTTIENLRNDNYDTSKLFCSDCEKIPIPDKHFDIVTCIGVLSYAENEIRILSELNRIVKDDGTVIVSVPNLIKLRNILDPYYYTFRVWKYLYKKFFNRKKEKTISDLSEYLHNKNFEAQNRYLLKQIYKITSSAGFHVKDIKGYVFFNPTFFRKQVFSDRTVIKINKFIEKITDRKEFKLLLHIPFGWVVCLKPIR